MGRHIPKVSVILTAYNVDRFVGRALQSIEDQTLKDIEILAIDDGSQDRTGDILDRASERDIRLDVFHTQNCGLSQARNFGINRAHGEYICFVNPEDWLEPTMLEDMVATADKNRLDLVVSSYFIDTYYGDETRHLTEIATAQEGIYEDKDSFRSQAWHLFENKLIYQPWNKLFLRSRIEDLSLRFEKTFWDEFSFAIAYIRDIERVGVLEKAYYHSVRSRIREENVRWKPGLYEKYECEHIDMLNLYNYWGLQNDPQSMELVQRRYMERVVECIENICNPKCILSMDEKRRMIKKMIVSNHAQQAARVAVPKSRMMQMIMNPIKNKNVSLVYSEGRFISFVKRRNTKMFASMKAKR